jgi:hypothetical protein
MQSALRLFQRNPLTPMQRDLAYGYLGLRVEERCDSDTRQASIRFPAPLYETVSRTAVKEHRTVNGQVLHLVELALQGRQQEAA